MACSNSTNESLVVVPGGKKLLLTYCKCGIHRLSFHLNNDGPAERSELELAAKNKDTATDPKIVCINWIMRYFENPHQMKDVPLPPLCSLKGETFQTRVWKELVSSVCVGETITYKELATRLNNPGAARAVGTTMKNNPVCILVPCHRVVRSDGIGRYNGPDGIKEWLLRHEGVDFLTEKAPRKWQP